MAAKGRDRVCDLSPNRGGEAMVWSGGGSARPQVESCGDAMMWNRVGCAKEPEWG